jgi:hypothetical protein
LETYGVPSSGDNGFGGGSSGGSRFGRPSGKYDAFTASGGGFGRQGLLGDHGIGMLSRMEVEQTASGSGFRRQETPGGNAFEMPLGTYGAPTSNGRIFSSQRNFAAREFGSQHLESSGAIASGNIRYGDKTHAGGNPLGGYGTRASNSGGIVEPSNVHISTNGDIGGHSQISGRTGSQNAGRPSGFQNAAGPDGGHYGSPSGTTKTPSPCIRWKFWEPRVT